MPLVFSAQLALRPRVADVMSRRMLDVYVVTRCVVADGMLGDFVTPVRGLAPGCQAATHWLALLMHCLRAASRCALRDPGCMIVSTKSSSPPLARVVAPPTATLDAWPARSVGTLLHAENSVRVGSKASGGSRRSVVAGPPVVQGVRGPGVDQLRRCGNEGGRRTAVAKLRLVRCAAPIPLDGEGSVCGGFERTTAALCGAEPARLARSALLRLRSFRGHALVKAPRRVAPEAASCFFSGVRGAATSLPFPWRRRGMQHVGLQYVLGYALFSIMCVL